MDDDIVFLGSSPATATLPTTRPAQRPVTGVSLHVEKNGTIDAHSLSFRRTAGTVVHIGRRSALDPEPDDSTTAASFRCAVVSRRHAKIAFSDSGHAYLIDLGSHHGTHVRSPADRVARALKPETPTLLVDGDVITFGKAVGKGDECVRPIVVRVELLHDARTPQPVLLPVPLPTASPASSKASSGRYGIRTSSSSSSDESAENDGYSDIEEIPPPVQLAPAPDLAPSQPPSQAQSSQTSFSNPLPFKFRHITALKRFLPPMHVIPQDAPWHSHDDRTHGYRHPQPDALAGNFHFHPPPAPIRLPPPPQHLHSMPTFVERPLAHLSQLSQFFLNGRGASSATDSSNAQDGNPNADAHVENVPDQSSSDNLVADAGSMNLLPPMDSSPLSPLLPPHDISEAYKRLVSQREDIMNDIYRSYDAAPKPAENEFNPERPYSPTREWSMLTLPPWDRVSPIRREKSLEGAGQHAALEDGELTSPAVHLSSSSSHSDSDLDSDSDDSDFSAASSRNSEREQREKEREKERGRDGASSEPMELASSRSSSLAPAARAVDKGKGRAVEVDDDADEDGEADMDIENDVDAPMELDALRKRAEKASQGVIRRIEEAVSRLEADLTIHRGQTKATLARHTNQMEVFDGRIREVDAECGVLCLRVETLGERLGVVEMDVASNTEANFNALEVEAEKERAIEDARQEGRQEGVHIVQALIAEAHEELRALKALRTEAEAHAAAARQQQQENEQVRRAVYANAAGSDADDGAPQPPVLPSLKRKRDDSDEDADEAAARGSEHEHPVLIDSTATTEPATENEKDKDVVMDASPLPIATSTSGFDSSASTLDASSSTTAMRPMALTPTFASASGPMPTIAHRDDARPPPRKRTRRIAGLMARTATAVGVGAVVTWTALAFS